MDEELSQALEELEDHDGQRLVWDRDSLQRALQIFFEHSDSLVTFLEDVSQQLSAGKNTSLSDEYNDQFLLQSHDYFSAAYGLFSKAQDFQSNWYCSCDRDQCSKDQCEKFEPYYHHLQESGLAKRGNYINSIRVVVQKLQTPCLLNHTKYNIFDLDPEIGVVINREELLKWVRRYNRRSARTYLEAQESQYLDFLSEVQQYNDCVEEFYGWLFSDVKEEYAHLLRDRRRIIKELTEARNP